MTNTTDDGTGGSRDPGASNRATPAAAALPPHEAVGLVPTALVEGSATPDIEALEREPQTITADTTGKSLTHHARTGAIWSAGGTVLMLGSTLLAQVIVGNILKTEYALNMLIVSVTLVAGLLRDAGIRRIAIASGPNFDQVARSLQQLSWVLNIAVGVLVLASAPLLSRHYFNEPHPELFRLLTILAITFAFGPAWMMQWAKMAIDLRFRTLTTLTLCSYLIRNASLVTFALCGATQLALVLPLLLSSTFESIAGRVIGGPLPRGPRLTLRRALATLMTSRWVMLALLGSILTTRADSFFISRIGGFDFDTEQAEYGFAILLAFSALTPFTNTMQVTLTPIFVRLAGDAPRLGNAFLRVVGVSSVLGSAAWLPAMLASGPVMHLLWRGKWDNAVPVVIGLLCMLIPKSLQAAALALDEARGRFRNAAILVTVDGITTVAFALAGAMSGRTVLLAAAISVHHAIFCLYHVLYVGRRALTHDEHAAGHLLTRTLAPAGFAAAALGLTLGLSRLVGHHWWPGTSLMGIAWAGVAVALYVALICLLQPQLFTQTRDLLLRRSNG